MILYHGTSAEAAEQIREAGFICGPVFLSARRDIAEDYAGEGEVIEASIALECLLVDLDMPGAALLPVADAAGYLGVDADSIEWFIDHGYSVGVAGDVKI